MARSVLGWRLDESDHDMLLALFRPRYCRTVANHVTLRFGSGPKTPLPAADFGEIVGEADDDAGVQALILRIGGTTARDDGSHFHITWSLDPQREAKESNDVIRRLGWRSIGPPIPVRLTPARWKG